MELYDATGKKLSENDDGTAFGQYVQCAHDFVSNDSWLTFRVIGRTEQNGRVVEREAQYMTLYGNGHNDRMHVRPSWQARAVLAEPLDTWLETSITEVSVVEGQTVNLPVKIHRRANAPATLGVVVNGPTPSAGCGLRAPITLTADQTEITIPLQVSEWKAGDYGITIARSWVSDLRGGRPGPCTPLIRLRVLPVKYSSPHRVHPGGINIFHVRPEGAATCQPGAERSAAPGHGHK